TRMGMLVKVRSEMGSESSVAIIHTKKASPSEAANHIRLLVNTRRPASFRCCIRFAFASRVDCFQTVGAAIPAAIRGVCDWLHTARSEWCAGGAHPAWGSCARHP